MATTDCAHPPGEYRPVIDRDRCEGKAECVRACPYDVFEIGTLSQTERSALGFTGKVKGLVHRWQQAYAVRADACHACGKCVSVCPENAIKLARA